VIDERGQKAIMSLVIKKKKTKIAHDFKTQNTIYPCSCGSDYFLKTLKKLLFTRALVDQTIFKKL
jgi:hypothetical protein